MKKFIIAALALALSASAFAQTQTIRVFSHRGGRMERDENTLEAFQASWDKGYHGFETDIRMTKDGVLYMTHDHTLERTTNGTGIFEEHTSKEIDQLLTKGGHKIMKFDDFCKFLDGKDSLYVEWEFKTKPEELYPEERLEKYVEMVYKGVSKIKTKGSQMVFTSSDYRGLRLLQMNHPDAELLLIISKPINDETIAMAKTVGIKTLGCTMPGTSRAMVKKAHEAGICVSLWPGQSVADFMLGAYLGCDRMCTDVPFEIMDWQKKNAPWLHVIY